MASSAELTGEVIGVYFQGANGFGVVEVSFDEAADDGAVGARCIGPLGELVPGQHVRLVGEWQERPRHGRTFVATFYEQLTPPTADGMRAFLSSDRFKGVGKKTADRILTAFGDQAAWVIERDPQRLVREAGLTRALADHVHETWRAGSALAELVRLVEPAAIPHEVVRAAYARFGATAADVVRLDPYALLEVERCRFAHADAVAVELGLDGLDPRRLAAGARAAHAAARARDGHQFLTALQLTQAASQLLQVDMIAARDGVEAALARGALVRDAAADAIYTPPGLRSERDLANDLARLLGARSLLAPFAGQVVPSSELTRGQADAVRLVFAAQVAVLTGGPGTGKTRTVQEVVIAAERHDLNVALCAPTGRAAKRLEELVGRPASTVHRLLGTTVRGDGSFEFRYGRGERLPHELIVCDEVSMCDTYLTSALVAAVDSGAHLLLVGDPDQLPSVGSGDVLRDLLRADVVPSVVLTEVHRQAAGSRIVGLAREINDGHVGPIAAADGDVFLAEERVRGRIVPRVVEAVATRVPAHLGVASEDVQVVAPVYRGAAGVDALNAALKAALNPGGGPRVAGFDLGDRVMQTRNDAELDVSNGDIGAVVDVDATKGTLRVGFPRGEVTYSREQAGDLRLAWAVTVHKSQGGEWPVVVFVCDRSHAGMLWRNLAYTAVTRAQQALVIVGQKVALDGAAAHDRPRNRQTLLAARLRQAVGEGAS